MWAALLVLLGAVIGGAASSLGSVYVARAVARRAERVTILNELLPAVHEVIRTDLSDVGPIIRACDALYWRAAAAGKADVRQSAKLQTFSLRLSEGDRAFNDGLRYQTGAEMSRRREVWDAERTACRRGLDVERAAYSKWLVSQLDRRFG